MPLEAALQAASRGGEMIWCFFMYFYLTSLLHFANAKFCQLLLKPNRTFGFFFATLH